jgi:hypothetical protein
MKNSLRHVASVLGVTLVVAGCGMSSSPPMRFDIRGLKVSARDQESYTQYYIDGTVVALGPDTGPSIVMVDIARIEGGDPELEETGPHLILMNKGVGDIRVYAGTRNKKTSYSEGASWGAPKYVVKVIGVVPVQPATSDDS